MAVAVAVALRELDRIERTLFNNIHA